MTKFIPFTEEQIITANNSDIAELLKKQGEEIRKEGRIWRWNKHGSVTICGNKWFQHKYEEGGYAIKFVERFFDMSFPEAVKSLLEFEGISIDNVPSNDEEPLEFYVPEKNHTMKYLYAYLLKTRFLDRGVVDTFVQKGLIYEDKFHSVVFAGYDDSGNMRHAHRKNPIKGYGRNVGGSMAEDSFHYIGTSDKVYVYEAPVDMLSYISLNLKGWHEHSYISNCGLSMIPLLHQLSTYSFFKEVNLCFDRDSAGDEATWKFKDELETRGYTVNVLKSKFNDWNEDLKCLNGVEPKLAVENPKYAFYEKALANVTYLANTCNEDYVNFQSFMQSYADLLCKLDDDKLITEQVQKCFEYLALQAYILFKRSYTLYVDMADETHLSNMKEYMQSHYRTYRDRSQLKTKISKIKMQVNELKKFFHNHEGSYLGKENVSIYLEIAEECIMASRHIQSQLLSEQNETLTFKHPNQNPYDNKVKLEMK